MKKCYFICFLVMLSASVFAANDGSTVLVGDMNADGRITTADVSALKNVVLGCRKVKYIPAKYIHVDTESSETPTEPQTENRHLLGDVNGDGLVSIADISLLIDVMSGNKEKTYIMPDVVYDTLGVRNGHEYIDLGLSVKWATYNISADETSNYGQYFAWGETVGKSHYDWTTYEWILKGERTPNYICKYTYPDYSMWALWYNEDGDFIGDNKTALDIQDDAANEMWGENWRMPTFDELLELKNNCTWVWTSNYQGTGLKGYVVTSKKTGFKDKSIFMPAAGNMHGTSLTNSGTYGTYWTRNISESTSYCACGLGFNASSIYWFDSDRCIGMSIRPVIP